MQTYLKDRFYKFFKPQGPDCWIWDGATTKNGYGQFRYNDKTEYAHRVSYIINYGPISDDLLVLHRCDVKRCVNPKHLYLGTHTDNMKDRVTRQPNSWTGKRFSRYSISDASQMKMLHDSGLSYQSIGDKFNADAKTIWNIVNNETVNLEVS
jgi:hypothetical protein